MTDSLKSVEPDLAQFEGRMQQLRALAAGDERWDDALHGLRAAADQLHQGFENLTRRHLDASRRQAVIDAERQLMRSTFRDLPLPVVLVDRDGRVRRGNQQTSQLLGVGVEYLSGKAFTGFLAVDERPSFKASFAACIRDGKDVRVRTVLLRQGHPVRVQLSLGLIETPSDPRPLVAIAALPLGNSTIPDAETVSDVWSEASLPATDHDTTRAMTRRGELLSETARILVEESESTPAPLLQRLSRALCGTYADWALVDLVVDGALQREVVCAPPDEQSARIARNLERAAADKAEIVVRVAADATSSLRADLEDADGLGFDDRAVPFLTLMRAHTLLSVPITDGENTVGVITLVRTQPHGPFGFGDQATMEEVGELLGRSLRRRRRSVADPAGIVRAPAPFVPITLPVTPALDVAWGHHDSADSGATSIPTAPFFDYYDAPGGWGIVLGSAEGDGPDRQAYVAMVRQWARLVGSNGQPAADVLEQLDAALRRLHRNQPEVGTVVVDFGHEEGAVRVRLCSAGHKTSFMLRADGRVQRTDGGGKPLNDGPGPELHEDAERLEAGDTLLLYSNEFALAANEQGDTFIGSGELAAALARGTGRSARTVLDGVLAALTAFTAGGRGGDAVAVTVRCTGRPR